MSHFQQTFTILTFLQLSVILKNTPFVTFAFVNKIYVDIYTNTETRNMTKFKEAEHDSAFMAKCLFLDNMQVAIFVSFI